MKRYLKLVCNQLCLIDASQIRIRFRCCFDGFWFVSSGCCRRGTPVAGQFTIVSDISRVFLQFTVTSTLQGVAIAVV